MAETIIARREDQFPFHGTWRENLYPVQHKRAPSWKPSISRAEMSNHNKKLDKQIIHNNNHESGKRKLRNSASDRAYKAHAQHETNKNVQGPKEKRRVFRKMYDSKGPHDERYYVSASSGTDGSKAETETLENEDGANVFVKLLHNQVLNYSSKSPETPIDIKPKNKGVAKNDKGKIERDQMSRSSSDSKDTMNTSINSRNFAPPSPTPDYLGSRKGKLLKDKRLISKSISNLAAKSEAIMVSHRNLSASTLQLSLSIPVPDYGNEKDEKCNKKIVRRPFERDVWCNANRFRGNKDDLKGDEEYITNQGKVGERRNKPSRNLIMPTETLKQVMKYRPPVADVVKEITKVSEKDKIRQRQRENMQKEAESIFEKEKEETKAKQKDKKRPKNSVESSSEEDEAQKIYREILEVVKTNSPASLQYGRGRMVGYGEEAQDTLRRGDKKNAVKSKSDRSNQHAFTRMRLSEDRESVTTSIDSYPFSPSSPWAHALPSRYNRFGYPVFPQKNFGLPSPSGPVSFAGFSSPTSQLTNSSLGPASLHHHLHQPPGRGKQKRKKKWFNIF